MNFKSHFRHCGDWEIEIESGCVGPENVNHETSPEFFFFPADVQDLYVKMHIQIPAETVITIHRFVFTKLPHLQEKKNFQDLFHDSHSQSTGQEVFCSSQTDQNQTDQNQIHYSNEMVIPYTAEVLSSTRFRVMASNTRGKLTHPASPLGCTTRKPHH